MAQVTFPPELGGDGNTYSDDSNPATGMGNGGHRTRFVPALGQGLAMATTARDKAGEALASAQNAATSESNAATSESNAATSESNALASANDALTQANRAETEADRAQQAALESDIYWHSEITGHGTGFLNHETTVLSADDGTRTLTIAPAGGATEFLTFDHNKSIPVRGTRSYQVADADDVSYLIFPREGEQPGISIPIISGFTDSVEEDSNYVYVGTAGSLTILRKGDMAFVNNPPQLPTGARPFALLADDQFLYVGLNEAPYFMVFAIGSWDEVTGYPALPAQVTNLAQDETYVYLGGNGAPYLYVINKETKTLVSGTPALTDSPIAVKVYGSYLVVESSNNLLAYSTLDFSLLYTINKPMGYIQDFDVGSTGIHVIAGTSPHYYVFELSTGNQVSGPPSLDGLLSFGGIATVKVTDTEVYLSLDYVEDPYFYRVALSDWSLNAIPLPNLTGTNAVKDIAYDSNYLYLVTYKGFTVVDRSTNTNITTVPQPVDALFDAGNQPGYNQRLVFLYGYDSENAHFWYVGDERHGTDRTDENHAWRHETFGLQWTSGGAVSYTLNDPSNVDLTLAGPIVLRDEDIRQSVTHSATPAESFEQSISPLKTTAVYRKTNGNATSTKVVSDSIWNMGTAAVTYNPEAGGIADVPDGKFVNYAVLFTMDFRAGKSIKSVMGRQVHDTLDAARGEAFIQGDLPHQEMRFVYIVTAKVNYAITENPYKLEVVEVRNAENPVGSVPVPAASSHDQLIHRDLADQHPASAIRDETGNQSVQDTLDGLGTAATRDVGTDTGNVMEVGAFGLGVTNAPGDYYTNLDNVVHSGFYAARGDAVGGPSAADGGCFVMVGRNDTKQLGWHSTTVLSFRGNDNPTNPAGWSDWYDFYHTGNMPVTATRWPTWAEVSSKPTGFGAVGTYVLAIRTSTGINVGQGSTYAGSSLRSVGVLSRASKTVNGYYAPHNSGDTLSGTWRAMGANIGRPAEAGDDAWYYGTLFLRIS